MKKIVLLLFCIFTLHTLGATSRKAVSSNHPLHSNEKIYQVAKQFNQGKCKETVSMHKELNTSSYTIPSYSVEQTQGQEIVLNFDAFTTGPKYYSSGDWYVVLENEDDWEVYLNWEAPKTNYCGTFDTDDFLHDYSYIFTPTNRENGGVHYEDITMTISINEISPLLDSIVLDATILGTDGNTYVIHATQEIVKAKNVIDLAIMNATITKDDFSYTISGQNEQLDISLVVLSERVAGIYPTIEDFDLDNSHLLYNGMTVTPIQIEGTVDIGTIATGDLAYGAQFTILSSDTVIYNIMLAAPLPDPIDTIDITCSNMRFDDSFAEAYNVITVNASNDDYTIQVMYYDSNIREGDYTEATTVFYITDLSTTEEVESLVAQMQIQKEETSNSYKIQARVRCTNNIVYNITLMWAVPMHTDTKNISFNKSAQASFYPQNNDLLLINNNDDFTLSLNIVGVGLNETFTLENIGMYYTSLYDKKLRKDIELAKVDGKISQSNDTTWIEVDIIGFDSVLYDVKLWYVAPTPTKTTSLHLTDVPFENHLEEGYFQFIAYTPDASTMVSFTVASEEVAGTFSNDGMFGKFGQGKYDFFNDYTYVAEWNNSTKKYDISTVEKGDLIVSMDDDGTINATASVICENATLYQITIQSKYARPHLELDTEEGAVDCTFNSRDKIKIDNYTQKDHLIVFEAISQEHEDMLVLYFFSDTFDEEIGIPEGIYPINHSLQSGTVLASTGVNDDLSVSPSLYSTLNGETMDMIYFFVDGTVEVTKSEGNNLHMEVNAINSYDVPIHIIYHANDANAVENIHKVDKTTTKIIVNNQLLIQRDNQVYTTIGTRVK